MRFHWIAASLLLTAATCTLSACGLKGPLYLPQGAQAPSQTSKPAAKAPADGSRPQKKEGD